MESKALPIENIFFSLRPTIVLLKQKIPKLKKISLKKIEIRIKNLHNKQKLI